ncbi:MAG: hypothetical protein HY590_05870 [Candidatus Omnitrophica bacterium]|nr:hypothetical protein [Candidatus Omnitrophota bacterium]
MGLKIFLRPSPEEQIRRLIQGVSKAAVQRNLPKTLSYASHRYSDDMGLDYQTVGYLVAQIYRAYPKISVSSKILGISVEGDHATAEVIAKVVGTASAGETEDLLSVRGSDRFLITFEKEEKAWKVVATKKPPQETE